MGLFNSTAPATVGVIIDIGSASVLVAIVASDAKKAYPDIIWSYREHTPAREAASLEQGSKNVLTALLNATLQLDTVGRKVLEQTLPGSAKPTHVQITVSAPWAHTVTKTVVYDKDEPFKISLDLLTELATVVQQKIESDVKDNGAVAGLGLQVLAKATTEILANGYSIPGANGQTTNAVTLSRTNALVPTAFKQGIENIEEKMFRTAGSKGYSFMLAYFYVTKALYPDLLEYCLVDVTFEAIEIGIVRDGVLRYCSHIPFGAYTLAREAASIRQVPLEEAYSSMISGLVTDSNETASTTAKLEALYVKLETTIAGLFLETGDSLSIPKTVVVHSNLSSETFFKERIKNAATMATRGTHTIIGVSEEILARYYPAEIKPQLTARHDTAVLITAQFFHTQRDQRDFEW